MKKGMLIVMEGACDGIGKSTQYDKLYDKLTNLGYSVVKHHFPSYNTFHGVGVEKYLNGEFGRVEDTNPYFINSLYANDRACAWYLNLKDSYDNGKIILLDRYTTSSLIYQSALIDDRDSKDAFIDYVMNYEYNKIGIAKPDMVLFLDAPFNLITNLRRQRTNYEGNSNDIHEKDLAFLRKVYNNAEYIANYLNWDRIECSNNFSFRSIEDIHDDICSKVLKKIKNN